MTANTVQVTPRQVCAAMYEAQNGLLSAKQALATRRPAAKDSDPQQARNTAIKAYIAKTQQQLGLCHQLLTIFPAAND